MKVESHETHRSAGLASLEIIPRNDRLIGTLKSLVKVN